MGRASLEYRDVHLRDLLIPKMEMAENLFWLKSVLDAAGESRHGQILHYSFRITRYLTGEENPLPCRLMGNAQWRMADTELAHTFSERSQILKLSYV